MLVPSMHGVPNALRKVNFLLRPVVATSPQLVAGTPRCRTKFPVNLPSFLSIVFVPEGLTIGTPPSVLLPPKQLQTFPINGLLGFIIITLTPPPIINLSTVAKLLVPTVIPLFIPSALVPFGVTQSPLTPGSRVTPYVRVRLCLFEFNSNSPTTPLPAHPKRLLKQCATCLHKRIWLCLNTPRLLFGHTKKLGRALVLT